MTLGNERGEQEVDGFFGTDHDLADIFTNGRNERFTFHKRPPKDGCVYSVVGNRHN